MLSLKERADRHDREIAAIRKLILHGARVINKVTESQAQAEKRMDRAEKRMDRMENDLKALIDALRGSGNGHKKRFVDIQ